MIPFISCVRKSFVFSSEFGLSESYGSFQRNIVGCTSCSLVAVQSVFIRWRHFSQPVGKTVVCNECKKKFIYTDGTTNLKYYLKDHHKLLTAVIHDRWQTRNQLQSSSVTVTPTIDILLCLAQTGLALHCKPDYWPDRRPNPQRYVYPWALWWILDFGACLGLWSWAFASCQGPVSLA